MRWRVSSLIVGRPRVGLVLGAGGARGWAHLGVLRAFREANVHFDVVTGTSIGAVVGAFYAADALDILEQFALNHGIRQTLSLLDIRFRRGGMLKGKKLMNLLDELLPVDRFEDLKIPFGVVAGNLSDMVETQILKGPIIPALRASISIPGFLAPYEYHDQIFVDGAILNPVPISLARKLGADCVVAVDLRSDMAKIYPDSIAVVANKTIDTMIHRIRSINYRLDPPTVVVRPELKDDYGTLDYHRTEEAIESGHRAASMKLHQILPLFKNGLHRRNRFDGDDDLLENLVKESRFEKK